MSTSTKTSQTASAGKLGYEGTLVSRSLQRAGRNPNLKGHIHEIMVKDARNLADLLNGRSTELTRSTTAKAVDLVTMKGGKVVERLQLKDSVSPASINKLVRQVADGKYRSTQLVGTKETTELANAAFKKAGLSKRMASSGTSSNTTTSLAQRAGASGAGTLGGAVRHAAKSGGAAGAAVGAGVEVISGVSDLINGRRDAGEVTGAVVKAGAKGYASGAAAGAAATAGGAVVASGLATVGAGAGITAAAAVVAPVVIGAAAAYAVCEVFDWLFD
ncbi:MAG: hypothetical protein IPQ01_05205 [Zoogloea sp.]|nr:hypothetical protein [Zoogloea sp.]